MSRDDAKQADAGKPDASRRWTDHRELRTTAEPEKVWRAWAEPEILQGWFPDEARGEAVPGGEIVHVWKGMGFEMPHRVLEVEPGRRLLLEATAPGGIFFRQEIRVRREGGETVLELIHSGFAGDASWDDEYEGIDSGWKTALAILRHYLEEHFGEPRTPFLSLRPATFEWGELERWFRSERGLGRWLARSGGLGEPGDEVALDLHDGAALTGEVLAWTGREAALTWREISGVLELKAFAAGPRRRMVGLRAGSWDPRVDVAAVRERLEVAVERLVEEMVAGR